MKRFMFKCSNKKCKKVWAREYEATYTKTWRYNQQVTIAHYYRDIPGEKARRELRHDSRCECGALADYNEIKGTVTDTPCNAKCTGATRHVCECSCGGKNHGKAHLI